MGTIALHGGGEFLPGDERFLRAILDAAVGARSPNATPSGDRSVRAAVVPTAAARSRPDVAAANGVAALTRAGAAAGIEVQAEAVDLLDAASAADPDLVARLAGADLVHFPGGDPDLIPTILTGTPAWAAILDVLARGGVVAGASAGAMAMGPWTWTSSGGVRGLGLVPGVVVVPHADADSWTQNVRRFSGMAPTGVAVLGLGERTGVLIGPDPGPWRIVGAAEVRWLAAGRRAPESALVLRDGDRFDPDAD